MKSKRPGLRNSIIASVIILAAIFAAYFIISRHNEYQKHYKGVFVINDYVNYCEYRFLDNIYV